MSSEQNFSSCLNINLRVNRADFDLAVNATIEPQSVCGIFGESGSGKTSLARAIAGLDSSWSGRLCHRGVTWQDTDSRVFVPAHKRRVGFVFQGAELFDHLTISKNLDFAERCGEDSEDQPGRADLIAQFELGSLLHQTPGRISGGERQRAAIAQVLLSAPSMLVMDEPMASMSRSMKENLMPFIKNCLHQFKGPMLYITHSKSELEKIAGAVLLLEGGRSRFFPSVKQFLRQSSATGY